MMQLIKIILGAITIIVLLPTIGYKLMGNNWPLLLGVALLAPLFLPKAMKSSIFLVMLVLLVLVWWKYDALNGALSKLEKAMTLGLTPQQAKDQADQALDDTATKTANAALQKMQETLNSCLVAAASKDKALGPKLKGCIANPAGPAYQQTKAFQACMDGIIAGADNNQTITDAAKCNSQVQPDIDDAWKGFAIAVLCKLPTIASNPNCPK